ncbi:MAG: NAD(P)H-dependent oxidoreductase [Synergistaceae bacterium]|nr:NAD(P)H-dependent oxidoreductase [Synergistaceae bacterium]
MPKTLTAYFTLSGHTKSIAQFIASQTNSPLCEIITEKKYPRNYLMAILASRKEFKHDERPAIITPKIEDFSSYERIIIGFPIWFFTCPMAVVSWLEQYDFTGKEIFPFCTSGGSNCVKATAKIRQICPGANVHDGIRFTKPDSEAISRWLNS